MTDNIEYGQLYSMLEELRDSDVLTDDEQKTINEAHYVVQIHEETTQ